MKTKAKPINQLFPNDIIRLPIGQTLYHRVVRTKWDKENINLIEIYLDGHKMIEADASDLVYVLEDESHDSFAFNPVKVIRL
jgi:hypothetical protein